MARLNQHGTNRTNQTKQRWGERTFATEAEAVDYAANGAFSAVSAGSVPDWQRLRAKVVGRVVRWPLNRDLPDA